MKVLVVKTSSLGDVIHTLPALTDSTKYIPNITYDWMVEASFSEIPKWHPAVRKIIPISFRAWRKNIFAQETRVAFMNFLRNLREESYDLIIDAQGLTKSAFLARLAKGKHGGLDWKSAREPLASLLYQKKCKVDFYQHAITRMRSVFSNLLNYQLPDTTPEYGISRQQFMTEDFKQNYLVFLHGTTWDTKLWPEHYWLDLARLAAQKKLKVKLLWGNPVEKERADRLANLASNIEILPRQNLLGGASVLANARAIVALDTGLAHLAAALEVPTVSLYGPTNPKYTGALGKNQINLAAEFPCAPCLKRECTYPGKASVQPACFSTLPPQYVWEVLDSIIKYPL